MLFYKDISIYYEKIFPLNPAAVEFLEEEFKPFAPDKNEVGNKTYSQRLRQRLLGAYEQYFLIRCQHDLQLPVDEICR